MTVPQVQLLQAEWHRLHPVARLMDLIYRFMNNGKGLWENSEKPRQVSEEKEEAVNPLLSDTLKRMGWLPPPGQA